MAIAPQTFNDLIDQLRLILPISNAFKQALSSVIYEEYHVKGTCLLNPREIQQKHWLLLSGTAREYTKDVKHPLKEQTQWFWYKGDFLYTTPGFYSQLPVQSYVEILEDSHFVYITFQDFQQLKKEHPEAEHLSELIRDYAKQQMRKYMDHMRKLSAKEKYHELFKAHPMVFNLAKQQDLAYFLGIAPDTLRKLRKER